MVQKLIKIKKTGRVINPVVVEWVDSMSVSGWQPHGMPSSNLHCTTVGHLLEKKKDRLVLCLNQDAYGSPGNLMYIPLIAVKSVRKLKL